MSAGAAEEQMLLESSEHLALFDLSVPESSPCGSVFEDSLSSRDDVVFIVAGTVFDGHTLSFFIHEGPFSTAAAVHGHEAVLTPELHLTEGATRPPTRRHVGLVHRPLWTRGAEASCRHTAKGFLQSII